MPNRHDDQHRGRHWDRIRRMLAIQAMDMPEETATFTYPCDTAELEEVARQTGEILAGREQRGSYEWESDET